MATQKQSIPRSEIVRERHNKPKREPASSKRSRGNTSTRRMPPVMVRGDGYIASATPRGTRRKRKTVKRRYDIALSTPGVEIRLPSVPVVRLGWRLVSFMLMAGLIALLSYLWTSPTYQVQVVEVHGAQRLTANEVNRALNVYNKPIFTLSPRQMEETLAATYPELLDVSVQVGLPATVVVTVDERVPLIEWKQEGDIQWVDADGFAFSPRGEAGSLVSVEAYGSPSMPAQIQAAEASLDVVASPKAFMSPGLVAALLTLRNQAPEGAPLVYDSTHGLGWSDPQGWDVFLGTNVTDIKEKLLVYQSIVERLQANGITPALINVEHVHAPYYRLER